LAEELLRLLRVRPEVGLLGERLEALYLAPFAGDVKDAPGTG
jgi:hypothetical protein